MQDECLNDHFFSSLSEERLLVENWRLNYNTLQPHSSLGGLPSGTYANLARMPRPAAVEPCHGAGAGSDGIIDGSSDGT